MTGAVSTVADQPCELDAAVRRQLALSVARALLALQSSRSKAIGGGLFSDPAWDMLLDLFAAAGEGRRVSVSSLCLASGVPASTAHRWLQALAKGGAIRRHEDLRDRRRVFVELSPEVARLIEAELLTHHHRMAGLAPCRANL